MIEISAIKSYIQGCETEIYSFAYRLTGEQNRALNLLCNALKACVSSSSQGINLRIIILGQISKEYIANSTNYLPNRITGSHLEIFFYKLPPHEKVALVLHDVLRLSLEEILEIVDVSEITFKRNLFYARNKLKNELFQKTNSENRNRKCNG